MTRCYMRGCYCYIPGHYVPGCCMTGSYVTGCYITRYLMRCCQGAIWQSPVQEGSYSRVLGIRVLQNRAPYNRGVYNRVLHNRLLHNRASYARVLYNTVLYTGCILSNKEVYHRMLFGRTGNHITLCITEHFNTGLIEEGTRYNRALCKGYLITCTIYEGTICQILCKRALSDKVHYSTVQCSGRCSGRPSSQ